MMPLFCPCRRKKKISPFALRVNNETVDTYDAHSDLTTVTRKHTSGGFSSSGEETSTYAYDAVIRKTSVTDPQGLLSSYAYDSANNQTTTTDPLSHVSHNIYDADNPFVSLTDALRHTTTPHTN